MAILTVTNTSGVVLNGLQSGGFGVSPDAVGGNVSNPLPFPFNGNGALAIGGTLALSVNPRDLVLRQPLQTPAVPAEEWDNLIQKGFVTIAYADNARSTDIENQTIAVIV